MRRAERVVASAGNNISPGLYENGEFTQNLPTIHDDHVDSKVSVNPLIESNVRTSVDVKPSINIDLTKVTHMRSKKLSVF